MMGVSKVFSRLLKKDVQTPPGGNNEGAGPAHTNSRPSQTSAKIVSVEKTEGDPSGLKPEPTKNEAEIPPNKERDDPKDNISQRFWDPAYDELAECDDTKELVEAYMKVILEVIKPDAENGTKIGDE
ncbi:hypothetical protein N7456_001037 [Penicillium angulare]|uniref:Uncharacterized protein n=1 Tax=Penicillium angulare TaxID=116970 RepID=A0A9W9KST4_9EURO|nr:hypothetical protein N7456_001037 [Penicillium angulare]